MSPATREASGPLPTAPEKPARWSWVSAGQLPLRLRLPDADQWHRRESRTTLTLEHVQHSTRIVIRSWSAARLVTPEQCLDELERLEPAAKEARSLLAKHQNTMQEESVDQALVIRDTFAPDGSFRGQVRAEVVASDSATLKGRVIAIASGVGRCVALLGETSLDGPDAEVRLADRLAWMVEGITKSISLKTVESRLDEKPSVEPTFDAHRR